MISLARRVISVCLIICVIICTASPDSQGLTFPELSNDIEGCPAWIAEYAQWHRANKDTPDAKYIAQACDHGGEMIEAADWISHGLVSTHINLSL